MPDIGQVADHLMVGRGHRFHLMQAKLDQQWHCTCPGPRQPKIRPVELLVPTLTRRAMLLIVTVVTPLNPDKILPVELSLSKEMFICLKAGSCNRSAALLGST